MMFEHVKQTIPGVVGMGTTATGGFIEWLTKDGLPVAHALAALGTAVAGFATAIYYFAKWLKLRREK